MFAAVEQAGAGPALEASTFAAETVAMMRRKRKNMSRMKFLLPAVLPCQTQRRRHRTLIKSSLGTWMPEERHSGTDMTLGLSQRRIQSFKCGLANTLGESIGRTKTASSTAIHRTLNAIAASRSARAAREYRNARGVYFWCAPGARNPASQVGLTIDPMRET